MINPCKNPLKHLKHFGQAFWLDDIRKDLIHDGSIQHMIKHDGLSGITSNPSIFEKAIAKSAIYQDRINELASLPLSTNMIYDTLSIEDVRDAADLFLPVYENTKGKDGFVSLEVDPHLSRNRDETIIETRRLWKKLDCPNIMIKVPATIEALPAITQLISEGININVTLIFGLERYRSVMKAYIEGLKIRLSHGKEISKVASVASFFVSRIDTLIDSLLPEEAIDIRNKTAIACGKLAFQQYKHQFKSDEFKALQENGAQVQRLLWASTGTKNAHESDIKYVEALIAEKTVTTLPTATLNAYRDHGKPKNRIEKDLEEAHNILNALTKYKIDLDDIANQLEKEGLIKFEQAYDSLLNTIKERT